MARRRLALMSRTGCFTIEKIKPNLEASSAFGMFLFLLKKLRRRCGTLSVAGMKLMAFMRRIARTRSKYGRTASTMRLVPTASTEAKTRALTDKKFI